MSRFLLILLSAACLLAGCSRKQPKVDKPDPVVQNKEDDPDSEENRKARAKKFLEDARKALADKRHEQAIKAFAEAAKILPDDTEARTGKVEAEKALVQFNKDQAAELFPKTRADLDGKRFQPAVEGFRRVRKLDPDNADALVRLKEAEQAWHRDLMFQGREALAARQFDQAVICFNQAVDLGIEADVTRGLLDQARKAQDAAKAADLVTKARKAMADSKLDDAGRMLAQAQQLAPQDPAVVQALADLKLLTATDQAGRYTKQMAAAQGAMTAKKYQDALTAYGEALKLIPGDPTAVKGQAEATALLKGENDAKQRETQRLALLKSARDALAGRRFDEAIKNTEDVLKLFPDDKEAPPLLQQARIGKSAVGETDRRDAFARFMNKAKDAVIAKKYAEAVKHYAEAVKLFPNDAEAKKGLDDATRAEAKEKNQRQEDYKLALDTGRDAVKRKDYQAAINCYKEALRLMPEDKIAQDALTAAQAALAKAENDKKKEEFDKLASQARSAATAKKYAEAIKLYEQALKLFPADAEAKKGLDDATRTEAKEKKQKQEDYKLALDTGRDAVKRKDYQAAINCYKEALRLMPEDKIAQDALTAAQTALKSAETEARKKQDYDRLINQGKSALAGKRFAEAAQHFQAAQRLLPNDADAKKGLDDVQQQSMQEFNRLLQAGAAASGAKNFGEAVRLYTEALKIKPNDPTASAALKKAREGKQ